jgi:predicted DCC family thiol-disulfide oxidoreductase YuxK
MTQTSALTLYYDGLCPFCVAEVRRLERWNGGRSVAFIDIAQPDFDPSELGVDMAALNRELHARRCDGEILTGIDGMLAAYTLLGRGWLVWPLRVRPLRPILAWLYRGFARHRYRISAHLGMRLPARCDGERCEIGNPFMKQSGTRRGEKT